MLYIVIVPFLKSFEGQKINYNIKDKYIKDKKVLEFVLNKAINMDFDDFIIPTASQVMLEDYKMSNDPVLEFVEDEFKQLMKTNDLDRIPKRTAHDLFKQFCQERNYKQMGYNHFISQFEKLISKDYEPKQIKWLLSEGKLRFNLPIDAKHPKKNQVLQGYILK